MWFGKWGSKEVPMIGGNGGGGSAMVEVVLLRLGGIANHIKNVEHNEGKL